MTRRTTQGPQFIRYFGPLIEALKALAGSGRPEEVKDKIVEQLKISDTVQNELIPSGISRFSNQVDWARFYLVRAGYLDSSVRGVWSLTEKGLQSGPLNHQQAYEIFRQVRQDFEIERTQVVPEPSKLITTAASGDDRNVPEPSTYRSELLNVLKALSPNGFERLCQRLLRESGFERVTVTGRSGDGGIDGIGVLQMTPFVSFKVLFQCKRYADSISSPQVRDFRGAMMGRADKGIIMTTGTFSKDAKAEAIRDGVPAIELVDGEKLIDLFESLELGLKPRKVYDVDNTFFEEFK